MEIKYTKDGKKVAVLGKLNNETWIVQEIFISDSGQELPCGENFTEKTLLDELMETWQSKQAKVTQSRKERAEAEINLLESKATVLRRKSEAAKLINKATEKYQGLDISELDTLLAFLSGEITHVVAKKYSGYEILSIIDSFEAIDSWYGNYKFEGIKMVTLFGCRSDGTRHKDDRSFSLSWRINQYADGSGSNNNIYPCRSYEEAVSLLDNLIADENAGEGLIELKEKHNLTNPSGAKIKTYRDKCIENKKASVKEAEKKLSKTKKELQSLVKKN